VRHHLKNTTSTSSAKYDIKFGRGKGSGFSICLLEIFGVLGSVISQMASELPVQEPEVRTVCAVPQITFFAFANSQSHST